MNSSDTSLGLWTASRGTCYSFLIPIIQSFISHKQIRRKNIFAFFFAETSEESKETTEWKVNWDKTITENNISLKTLFWYNQCHKTILPFFGSNFYWCYSVYDISLVWIRFHLKNNRKMHWIFYVWHKPRQFCRIRSIVSFSEVIAMIFNDIRWQFSQFSPLLFNWMFACSDISISIVK